MDPDQHRQKRSRVRSTDVKSDLGQQNVVDDDEGEPANPTSQNHLSPTTAAFGKISLQDRQKSGVRENTQQHGPAPPLPQLLLQHPLNPTTSTSFLSHPSFHQSGASTPKFSFNLNQNCSDPPPIPQSPSTSSLKNGSPVSADSEVPMGLPAQPVLGSQSILPMHRSPNVQPFSGMIAGPSSRQVELEAQQPPPQTEHPRYRTTFPGFQPNPPQAQDSQLSLPKPLMTPGKQNGRPKAIYVPASEEGKTDNPYSWNSSRILSSALSIGAAFSNAATQNPNTQRPSRGEPFADNKFPYPSIYPANERRANSKDPVLSPSTPSCPPNHYTSPNRIPNAALVASRKRKRGWPALAPPAYIYTRTGNPSFNIFDGILLYPELCFALAASLPVNDLLSLYAISKDYHTIIDTRFATVILSQSQRKCPEGAHIFAFRCYRHLCRPDPAPRIPHPHPAKQAAGEIRRVPSFRWLKMVLFREKVCHEIMTLMAEDGVPVPSRCELALKKMWFLMDIPDNARRIGLMHTKKLTTDLDLYFMMCFIVKLDLRFNDPVAVNRHHGLRKTLLAQRGLLPLWRALKRGALLSKYDVLKMWVATKYVPGPDEEGLPIFGVPGEKVGKIRMEYWGEQATHDSGKACTFLLRPDQIVMREIIRRQIIFSKHFLRCLLWGYVNIVTMKNYQPRDWDRRIKDLDEEYDDDDECGGLEEPANGVRDELLDLGIKKPVSMLVAPRTNRTARNSPEETFLEACMKWYKDELQLNSYEANGAG